MPVIYKQKNRHKYGILLVFLALCSFVLFFFHFKLNLQDNKLESNDDILPSHNTIYKQQCKKEGDILEKKIEDKTNINDILISDKENTFGKISDGKKIFSHKTNIENLEVANDILEFYNKSIIILSSKWYNIPHHIENNITIYTETWQLPKLKFSTSVRNQSNSLLLSGKNLKCFEGCDLEKFVKEMDAAVNSMIADYSSLEKYNNNNEIIDDWRKGNEYVKSIEKNQKKFLSARMSWLKTVRPEVFSAEKLLLQNHPLQRHTMIARTIFDLFSATASALGQNKIDRKIVQNISQQLDSCLEEAKSLSFSSPQIECAYRNFLAATKNFATYLHEGISSGFYQSVRNKLNQQISTSRDAYNKFVDCANIHHGTLTKSATTARGGGLRKPPLRGLESVHRGT